MSDSATNGAAASGAQPPASKGAAERTADGAAGADRRYASTISVTELAAALRTAKRPLLLSHSKPDGDAIGSLLALHHLHRELNATPTILLMGPVEPSLVEVAAAVAMKRVEQDGFPTEEPDLIMVVDTGAWAQLEPASAWLRERADRIIGIDHHARGDDVAPRRIIDATCASTTQLITRVVDEVGVQIDAKMADALFMGLATDTGWFRFSSADHRVFSLAARLIAAGADKDRLYTILEQAMRPSQLALQARALTSMKLLGNGRAAIMRLSPTDFSETGAALEDTGGIVNDPLVLRGVRVSILLTEHEPGLTRISFRSKPPVRDRGDGESDSVDVNVLASRIGGGGHRHAAGGRLQMPLNDAAAKIAELVATVL